MTRRQQSRIATLLPLGAPRFLRVYDNRGETCDRYTAVFTGPYRARTGGQFWYIGMSGAPFHPQGIGYHGEHSRRIDRPRSSHLGRRIRWAGLPADCQRAILSTYCDLWDLPLPDGAPPPSITIRADRL